MASRILIVWLFNNTGGSVFAVALFHATLNLTYMLFPVNGSHFDMRLGGLVMVFAAVTVTVLWVLCPSSCPSSGSCTPPGPMRSAR